MEGGVYAVLVGSERRSHKQEVREPGPGVPSLPAAWKASSPSCW